MGAHNSIAKAILQGDSGVIQELRQAPLVPCKDNLVTRPWGGNLLSKFKELPTGPGDAVGECFEISAWPGDREASQFPSVIRFEDGSELPLPALLAHAGRELLGPEFESGFPLLPKLLDIKELLSIQGHPPGNTEVYVILQADAGATLCLGFNRDMDPIEMGDRLKHGRRLQQALLDGVQGELDANEVQAVVAPWLAQPGSTVEALPRIMQSPRAAGQLRELHEIYWWMLDALNKLPAQPGQVILNANPARVLAPGQRASAEVHALGNPQRAEVLALEIRKPGPTFRAWDNVRFPVREVDVDAAVQALSLKATSAADFLVDKQPLADQPGLSRSVDCDDFCIDHAELDDSDVNVANPAVHCLHVVGGAVDWIGAGHRRKLQQGESAIVPAHAGDYRLSATGHAEVVKVTPKFPS